jgi:hypothetical protein
MSPRPTVKVLSLALLLAGCATTAAVLTGVGVVVKAGQEVCAIDKNIVAVQDITGAPVTVTGKAAVDVAKVCTDLGGIVVSPPPAGQTVPTITVTTSAGTVVAAPTSVSVTAPVVAPAAK